MALDTPEAPFVELSKEDRMLALVEWLADRQSLVEGRAPNFFVREFDLNFGESLTINSDWKADRWIVYFRPIASGRLRCYPGGSVPGSGAIEIETGRAAVIANVGNQLSFNNPSGSVNLHVFAVAAGGGADFEIIIGT
jgi:hypothetical protein